MKKIFEAGLACLVAALLTFALPAQAQLVKGQDYSVIEPAMPTDDPAKIEVAEFFSYACPHCNELNPLIQKWAAKQPSDVVFKHIALPGSPYYTLMSRFYYALEAIGEAGKFDAAVFEALHVKGLRLIDEKSITDWVQSKGIDTQKFTAAFKSFGVDSKIKQADQIARTAKIEGVPTVVVDGRYMILNANLKSYNDLLVLIDKAIDMRRKERAQKKK